MIVSHLLSHHTLRGYHSPLVQYPSLTASDTAGDWIASVYHYRIPSNPRSPALLSQCVVVPSGKERSCKTIKFVVVCATFQQSHFLSVRLHLRRRLQGQLLHNARQVHLPLPHLLQILRRLHVRHLHRRHDVNYESLVQPNLQ